VAVIDPCTRDKYPPTKQDVLPKELLRNKKRACHHLPRRGIVAVVADQAPTEFIRNSPLDREVPPRLTQTGLIN